MSAITPSHPPAALATTGDSAQAMKQAAHADGWRRAGAFGLSLVAVAVFVLSVAQPWWRFKLYAPQYPHGLTLIISLTGLSGDVHEIYMLNHYIGMAHLDEAAAWERAHAGLGVALLCAIVLVLAVLRSPRYAWLASLAGALFPLGFLLDSFYWLRRFGHVLDPRAPLHIDPFTPQLFGNGSIGQFMTFALPERGFWLAVAGVVALAIAALVRGRRAAREREA